MLDITNDKGLIERLYGNSNMLFTATEYVIGYRINISYNGSDNIDITEDSEFNAQFKPKLDLLTAWGWLKEKYEIEPLRLSSIARHGYTLNCIYYDPAIMGDRPQNYKNKGLVVVEVDNDSGGILRQSQIHQFCWALKIPVIKTLFRDRSYVLSNRIYSLLEKSTIFPESLPGGLVIRKELPTNTENKYERWLIRPEQNSKKNEKTPESSSYELVRVALTPDVVLDIANSTRLNPKTQKTKFAKAMLSALKDSYANEYINYKKMCINKLGSKDFDKYVKKSIGSYINDYVIKMDAFKNIVK